LYLNKTIVVLYIPIQVWYNVLYWPTGIVAIMYEAGIPVDTIYIRKVGIALSAFNDLKLTY
jgi:hypothetical protein